MITIEKELRSQVFFAIIIIIIICFFYHYTPEGSYYVVLGVVRLLASKLF